MESKISAKICLLCLIFLTGLICQAQTGKTRKTDLPRVALLKNDEPHGTDVPGCDSHPISFRKGEERSFFISHPDGLDAWMNLDGHNVNLRLLKATLYYRDEYGTASATYEYRYKKIRITVSLLLLSDYTVWIPAQVVIRKNQTVRRIKAFIAPQCDAI